ncbi:MAG TPA: PQQ-binding-like beta-propeller repeat protein [Gemmataceae bacterium]|nr:PQQ-binding-like beta-propeller repeat protein [Gemmataceae bacterium]
MRADAFSPRYPNRAGRVAFVSTLLLGLAWPCLGHADDWPQWLGPRRDGVWRETGILATFPKDGPRIRWRTPIGGGYAGPAVTGGRVYVHDRVLAAGARNPSNAFATSTIPGRERVLCLDEANGKVLWKHEYNCPYAISYPAGPRATPLVHGGKVYTLGAMGDLLCLNAGTGKVLWSHNLPSEYSTHVPLWGYAAHPLLDGDRLICLVGGKGSEVVAFHKDTGKELWRSLTLPRGDIGYCPPTLIEIGGRRQLIIWDPQSVHGLNPATGEVWWSQPFRVNANMTIPTPRQSGARLFLTNFYDGAMMLQLDAKRPAATVLWKGKTHNEQRTDALHSVMSTPVIKDGYIYGVCSYGQLRCLKADTGERVWETFAATTGGEPVRWANAFLIPQGDRYFLFNEKGDLIIARLTPAGYDEISRAHILEPTNHMPGRPVVWSHPAFADRCAFIRNDKEIVCVDLAEKDNPK